MLLLEEDEQASDLPVDELEVEQKVAGNEKARTLVVELLEELHAAPSLE